MVRVAHVLIVLGVVHQCAAAAGPSALAAVGDPNLVGIYRITSAEGPNTPACFRGFAAITRSCGVISNDHGTSPLIFTFTTAKQNGQNWIDLTVPGDSDKRCLHGIYEIAEDTVRICMAPEDVAATHGRPSSFATADPKLVSKLVLKRVPKDEPPTTARNPQPTPAGR